MTLLRTSRLSPAPARHLLVDDAYTAWFNAESRCARALDTWSAATGGARAAAFRAYVAELRHEEAAASQLERLHALWQAA